MTSTSFPAGAAFGSRSSSFYWPIVLAGGPRRAALAALYRYCRVLDDIADGPWEPAAKLAAFEEWQQRLDGTAPLPAALARAVDQHHLPINEFRLILEGTRQDVAAPLLAPDRAELSAYCRRVAGAVGVLCMRIFAPASPARDNFAILAGEALQLTNILRDVREDAAIGRIYLPQEVLSAAGIGEIAAHDLPQAPELPQALAQLGREAGGLYGRLTASISEIDAPALWPAMAMVAVYQRLHGRLAAGNWTAALRPGRVRISGAAALGLTLACRLGWRPSA
ncbi:phytoene/squalene synthase family protein [Radicibacter daui]|uniref:phytoene/squalene synthase family protein n=1 Tax=Radicibacter daui TaxID=3064829 RepID=UPI004046AC5A